jgi:hypothetical protein
MADDEYAAQTAFLRARLDEDEVWAREAVPRPWLTQDNFIESPDGGEVARFNMKADARLAAQYDPARVLREVEAKRRILDQLGTDLSYRPPVPVGHRRAWAIASLIAEAMAGPYSDHPDYRRERKP